VKTIEIADATGALSDYAQIARRETVVVTRRGRPIAAVVPIDDTDLETLSVSTNPDFIAIIERSRARYRAEGGISLDEMRKKYRVPRRSARRLSRRRRGQAR
jgi:prevent-host-death family protein